MKKEEIEQMINNLPEEPLWLQKCNEAIVKGLSGSYKLKVIPLSDEVSSLPTFAIPSTPYFNKRLKDIDYRELLF